MIIVLQDENTENVSLPTENKPDEEAMPEEFVDDETTTEKVEEGNSEMIERLFEIYEHVILFN